jgi:hypothetical protein
VNQALEQVFYDGILPITSLSNIFMVVFNLDSSTALCGIVQTPDQPYIHVSRNMTTDPVASGAWYRVLYNEIVFERGNGILYDIQTGRFTIRQQGLYHLMVRGSDGNLTPNIAYYLRFKKEDIPDTGYLAQSSTVSNDLQISTLLYFSKGEYTFPITNLGVDWRHDSATDNYLSGNYVNKNWCAAKICFLG